jgi:DNA-binding NarL/FixJ family response regulator
MENKPIRLLLVDDHMVVRNGIRLMLSNVEDIVVRGEADSAREALRLVQSQEFDVALVDIGLPDRSGIDLIRMLHDRSPGLAILVLSMYSEKIYAARAFKQGAAGYLDKHSNTAEMVAAIRKVAAGGKYVSPAMMETFAGMLGDGVEVSHAALSDRELEVLKLLASGHSLTKIGENLHLSPNTVSTYRARILKKMHMESNAELTRYALENNLL